MKTHKVLVRDRPLSCDSKTIPQGSHGQDEIVLDLDTEWDGLTVYMVIQRGEDKQILNYTEESRSRVSITPALPPWGRHVSGIPIPIPHTGPRRSSLLITRD